MLHSVFCFADCKKFDASSLDPRHEKLNMSPEYVSTAEDKLLPLGKLEIVDSDLIGIDNADTLVKTMIDGSGIGTKTEPSEFMSGVPYGAHKQLEEEKLTESVNVKPRCRDNAPTVVPAVVCGSGVVKLLNFQPMFKSANESPDQRLSTGTLPGTEEHTIPLDSAVAALASVEEILLHNSVALSAHHDIQIR